MFDLKIYIGKQKKIIDTAMHKYLARLCISERMRQPLSYSISAGGKRVRPILCLAAFEAVGGNGDAVLPVACALEMIHTYSLIHDDLPALDNDDLRRGQPTCHIQFDEATAILSGDALLTMAFEVMSEAGLQASDREDILWLQIMDIVSRAAGCRGMIEGQARDLAFEGQSIDRDNLEALHRLKTGAMIKAAVHSGGLLGRGSSDQISHLISYADYVGLAFQVVDDLLNVKGDPSKMGKAVGTDLTRKKNTYPTLIGLENSESYAHHLIDHALKSLAIFDKKADPLREIARYIVRRDH
ncbi:MAG: polyprenyl synthetase family protein [Desulfobacteraceae bacterium]|nr:polyprenyl synthetase family protein [Desulfobacteraceae bacterium]